MNGFCSVFDLGNLLMPEFPRDDRTMEEKIAADIKKVLDEIGCDMRSAIDQYEQTQICSTK